MAIIHAFRPRRTLPDDLEAIFVGREHLIEDLVIHMDRWKPGVSRQHYLFIGPRGVGKTNLIIILENRIKKSRTLEKKWCPISLPEDLYGITKVSDLLVESLGLLAETTGDSNSRLVFEKIKFDNNEKRVIDLALDAFRNFYNSQKRGIIMMVENAHRLLERDSWYQSDIRLLRKILIEEDWLMMVFTSPTFLNAVTAPEEPLFEFFNVRILSDLTFEEQRTMLQRLAQLERNENFENYMKKYQSRLQALYHFTGGNPRLAIMLYDLIANQNITEMKVELDLLLDKLTPFYQERMKDIPPEQCKLLEAMAILPEGCTPTKLAEQTRMSATIVRALIARLEKVGYIRKEQRRRKKTVYILSDRFFRIWHQINHSRGRRGQMQYLLEFFADWYASREERELVWRELLEKYNAGIPKNDANRSEDILEFMKYIAAVSESGRKNNRFYDQINNIIGLSNGDIIDKEFKVDRLKDSANNAQSSAAIAFARLSLDKFIPNLTRILQTLVELVKTYPPESVEALLRQILNSAFRSGNLQTVRDSLKIVTDIPGYSKEFYAPYLIALEYLESDRNPAVIERQHLEMREAVLLLVNDFDASFVKQKNERP